MDSNTPIFDPTSGAWQYPGCIQGNHMHIQVATPTVVMNFTPVPTSMNLQPNFVPPVQVMPMMQQCYGSPMQMMQQQQFAQKDFGPQKLWHVQPPIFCDMRTNVLSEVLPEGLLPIQAPVVPTVNNSVGNSNQVPTPMSGMQNFQAHAAVATHVNQNVSARFPQRLPVTGMQNLQYHGTTDTSSDTVVLYAVGEEGLQGTYEGEGYFDIAIQSINGDGTYNITYVEYGDVAVLAQDQIRRKQADLSPLEIESRLCFEELQSNVYWDDDRNIIENLKRDFDIVRGRDENHNRNCPQDYELEMTNSFLNVVTGISKILGQEGLTTRDLPEVLDELESALVHMMRKNFDEKCGVDFSESVHLKSLLVSIQSFKIKNVYALSLESLRNLRCHESELNHYVKLIDSLQSTYLHFRAIQPDRLQSYVEIVHEIAKIFTSEIKLQSSKRRIQALTADCMSCLKFVKSDAFDPVEPLNFNKFLSKARALKFNVLLFKILKVQNCKLGENQPRDCAERGAQVVRLRLKRVCNCDRQGFQLVEFLYQIKETNAVEIKSMLVRHDYKSSQSRSQERKLTGLLVYVNCSTAVEAEKLLQLLFAWGERKEVRDLVFQRYPQLFKKQTDRLTPEEDRARSEDRQEIIRKSDSIPRHKDFYDSERNMLRHEFVAAINDDESKRRSLCEVNLSESRWSPDNLACQKAMYHFDFARRKVDPTAETSI